MPMVTRLLGAFRPNTLAGTTAGDIRCARACRLNNPAAAVPIHCRRVMSAITTVSRIDSPYGPSRYHREHVTQHYGLRGRGTAYLLPLSCAINIGS